MTWSWWGRERWSRVGWLALAGTGTIFLGLFLASSVQELREHDWAVRPWMMALSMAIQAVGMAMGALGWTLLLHRMGTSLPLAGAARILLVSGLLRYVPGKVWPFMGAARLAAPFGMSATLTMTALAANTVFALVGALLAATWCLPFQELSEGVRLGVLRWSAPGLLLLAHPRVIGLALAIVARLTRRDLGRWAGTWGDGLGLVGISLVGWVVTGLALYTLVLSLTPLPPTAWVTIIGINALAFVLGQAFFIAPGGLGAKEGVLAAALILYVSLPVAALLAISVRLWATMVEVVLAAALLRWSPKGAVRAG